jgi:cholinesterase
MVWIHGGGFEVGNSASPAYNGARLALEQDVIVVNIK